MATAAQNFITLLTYQNNPANAATLAAHNRQVQQSVARSSAAIGAIAGLVGSVVAGALTTLASGISNAALGIVRANDQMAMSYAKLSDSIGNVEEAKEAYEGLYSLAMQTGVSVNESANAFARFRHSTKEIKATNAEVLKLVSTLQKEALLSGASTAEVNSVTTQLSQAFGNPALQGQELNSLLDAAPGIVRAISNYMKIPYGEIKKAAEQGKLVIPEVFKAILQYGDQVDARFRALPVTVGRAWDILGVAVNRFVAEANDAFEINKHLSTMIQYLSYLVDRMRMNVIPAIRDFVREVGGLSQIAKLAGFALLAMVGPSILAGIFSVIKAIRTLNMAILTMYARVLLVPAAIFAIALALEDLYVWMQGGDSSIGARLGPFDQLMSGIREAMGEWGFLIDAFKGAAEYISQMDKGILALSAMLLLLIGPIRAISVALSFAIGMWQGFWKAIQAGRGVQVPRPTVPLPPGSATGPGPRAASVPATPYSPSPVTGPTSRVPWMNPANLMATLGGALFAKGIGDAAMNATGAAEARDAAGTRVKEDVLNFFTKLWSQVNGNEFQRPLGSPIPSSSPITNNVTINVDQNNTVNATGVNPNEISAATNRAVPTGDDIARSLSERLTRSILQANPRSESAAQ